MFTTILLFLIVLSVLVLAHEWGHYFTAKKMGMKVEEFGLGFPPRLFSWTGKDGMKWSLNLIPLGGFVKITGESGDHRNDPDAFSNKSIPARILVLAAGVIMNVVLAAGLYTAGFAFGMPAVVEGDIDPRVMVSNQAVRVTEVLPESPADLAGFELGDTVLSVNGLTTVSGEAARQTLHDAPVDSVVTVRVERDGAETELAVTPAYIAQIDATGIGVAIADTGTARYPWYLAPVKGIETTVVNTGMILSAFYDLLRGAFMQDGVALEFGGPVRIASITGEVASLGLVYLIQFAAFLSINLAILNILPFPALDGGRIAFVLLEAVRRKPTSPQFEAVVHNVGFAVLMMLVLFVTYKDIVSLL